MPVIGLGCCGAYCNTCKSLAAGSCKGCKLGYDTGERDPAKMKCSIKACCFRDHGLQTCADCSEYETCPILGKFYGHESYKYKKYHEAIEYIRQHGYDEFFVNADLWNAAYGKLK